MRDARRGREGRVVGGMLVLLGILSLWEGWRLHALRTQMVAGAVVGDDTFPFIVGAALLLLGASILFVAKLPQVKVARASREPSMRMILGAGVLSGTGAITGNLTIVNPQTGGYVSVGPTVSANPTTSTINFAQFVEWPPQAFTAPAASYFSMYFLVISFSPYRYFLNTG